MKTISLLPEFIMTDEEIKSLAGNIPIIFEHQLISYLKASSLYVGLLINFSNKSCQVKRVVF